MRKRAVLRYGSVGLALLLHCLTLPSRALACVVGSGTGASCTESTLDACLPGGGSFDGTVTFNCGGAATIPVTSDKTINADTTIDGGSLITLSGVPLVAVFGVGTGVKLRVQSLTITNGSAGYVGGGIYNNGTVTVTNCTFSGNGGAYFYGGAIVNSGTLTVTNSSFSGNSAVSGGGIYNSGTLTVTGSTFSSNSAGGGDGGGIYNYGGTLVVTDSTFSGNSASATGGGISNNGGTLTVTNSTFSGNSADSGGGIENGNSGTVTVTNSTFSHNSGAGGGIDNSYRGTVTVTNSTFSDNSTGSGVVGGGIGNDNTGTVTVTNSTFSGNSAAWDGGGISNGNGGAGNGGTVTVTNSTFSGNSAGLGGGGIDNFSGTVTVTNTILASSPSGGNCAVYPYGFSVTDGGHNVADDGSCGFSGTSLSNTTPMLAVLGNNGGPTETIALCTGPGVPSAGCTGASPAINAGDESVCSAPPVNNLDQRGYVRPGAGATHCSIGAYEYNAVPASPATCAGDCDGSGDVTVKEVIALVNIALGTADAPACPNSIPSTGSVDIAVIIQAVNNALNGCAG